MHPSALRLLIGMVAVVVVHAGHPAAITPAAQFWQQALPGTTIPEAIADLVQKGIDHSPLVEHYSVRPSISACVIYSSVCNRRTAAETGMFFHEEQLQAGSTITLSFPAEADSAPILPQDVAEAAPFGNLRDVLSTFNIPAGSAEAAQVRDTLRRCQEPPSAVGEAKACATSLESTVRAATGMLGTSQDVLAAASPAALRAGLPRGPYVVRAATPLDGVRYVSCHKVPFPYAVYHCHIASMGYRAYEVSLSGLRRGGPAPAAVTMLALCHVDTSGWNPAHPAFEILNTRPGGTPVCHFMPFGDLAFIVKKADTAA